MSDRDNYKAEINTSHADNTTGDISALDGRNGFNNLADFVRFKKDDFPINTALTTGTGSAYNVTIDYPDALTDNYSILLKIHTNNTSTTPTLTITPTGGSALTAKTMKRGDGSALKVGDLVANKYYLTAYDGTDFLVYSGVEPAGDVVGPVSATDNAIVRYDGTTGLIIQDSGVTIDDSDNISGITSLNLGNENLDFFSEGTWTPTIIAATTNPTVTYTTQQGWYMRIADTVLVNGYIVINTISGGSGAARWGSLPYTPDNTDGPIYGAGYIGGVARPANNPQISSHVVSNNIGMRFHGESALGSPLDVTDLGNGDVLSIHVSYRV